MVISLGKQTVSVCTISLAGDLFDAPPGHRQIDVDDANVKE
jgi:hypothetical protein